MPDAAINVSAQQCSRKSNQDGKISRAYERVDWPGTGARQGPTQSEENSTVHISAKAPRFGNKLYWFSVNGFQLIFFYEPGAQDAQGEC